MSLSTHGTLVVPLSVRQMADSAHGSPASGGPVRQVADFAHGVLFRAVPCVRWPISRTESCGEVMVQATARCTETDLRL
jgi:hypothetical protein